MKRTLKAGAIALVTLGVVAPAASAMDTELNALTGAVYNELNSMQMDLAMIQDLTLADIGQIRLIMGSGDSESEKRNRINEILRTAAER